MVWEDRSAGAFRRLLLGALVIVGWRRSTGNSADRGTSAATAVAAGDGRSAAARKRPAPQPNRAKRQARDARRHTSADGQTAHVATNRPRDVATKTLEPVINTLAPVSVLRQEQIKQAMPTRLSDIFNGMPSVWFAERGPTIRVHRLTSADCRISGGSPRSSMACRRISSARATSPTGNSISIRKWWAAPTSCAVRSPISTVPARSAAWLHSAPRISTTSCCPERTQAIQSHAMFGTNGDQWLASTFGGARRAARRHIRRRCLSRQREFTSGTGTLTSFQCVANCAGYPTTVIPGNSVCSLHRRSDRIWDSQADRASRRGTADQAHRHHLQYQLQLRRYDRRGDHDPGDRRLWREHQQSDRYGPIPFKSPETSLFDFKTDVYWNQTDAPRDRQSPLCPRRYRFLRTPGTSTNYLLNTTGTNVNNTSRFDTGAFRQTVTYGGDFNNDRINVGTSCGADQLINGACNINLTPEWPTQHVRRFRRVEDQLFHLVRDDKCLAL